MLSIGLWGGGCGAGGAATVSLDGAGGDAWTFDLRVTGTAAGCDEVRVESPRGTAVAPVVDGRFEAQVALGEDLNEITAVCAGTRSAAQRWNVRIDDVPRAVARAVDDGAGLVLDGRDSGVAPIRGADLVTWEWTARAVNPAPLAGLPATGRPSRCASRAGSRARSTRPTSTPAGSTTRSSTASRRSSSRAAACRR